jgi:hypothetical protein
LLPNSRAEGEAPDHDPGVTGQYLTALLSEVEGPLLERASSSPAQAGAQVAKPKTRRKASADQPDLVAAK